MGCTGYLGSVELCRLNGPIPIPQYNLASPFWQGDSQLFVLYWEHRQARELEQKR